MLRKNFGKALKEIITWNYTDSESGDEFVNRVVRCLQKTLGVAVRQGSPEINDEIPIGTTIFVNPYGSQNSPDVAVISLEKPMKITKKRTGWIPNVSLTMEVKRSQTGKAMWNSGFPVQKRIYLLNTKSHLPDKSPINGTTIVMGSDLVSEKDEQKVIKLKGTLKQIKEQWATIGSFKLEHLRPMFSQDKSGGDWLVHKDRVKREKNVLKFVEGTQKKKEVKGNSSHN